ncbi:MAG: helix-turn-helix domain-containing protein [Oscillospiraceae bacterium]|nr:helix-turn-helix domain-containing protein [Oscillospiraceae bacterium]
MNKEKLTYTMAEVSQLLSLGRNRTYELLKRPDFPAIWVSPRRVVVPISALESWLDSQIEKERCNDAH